MSHSGKTDLSSHSGRARPVTCGERRVCTASGLYLEDGEAARQLGPLDIHACCEQAARHGLQLT